MATSAPDPIRPVLSLTRGIFLLAAILAAIAGVQLYLLTDHTEHFFAWTIANPLSATFLGTGYWAGTALLLFGLRERAWANIRLAMAAVSTFVPAMLLTTLLHLDRFHFGSSDRGGRVAAWAWLIVYLAVPVLVLVIYVAQLRIPGGDPPDTAPVPLWIRLLLGINGAVSLIVGLALMLIPERLFSLWPWQLTPLTARGIGSGFLSMAVASFWFIRENAWSRGRVGTVPYLVIGALDLIALVRYRGHVLWSRPGAWLYVLFMVGVLLGGIYSTIATWAPQLRRDTARAPMPGPT